MQKINIENVLDIKPKQKLRQLTSFGILFIFSIVQLFSQPAAWAESGPITVHRDLLTPTKAVTQTSTSTTAETSIRSTTEQPAETTKTLTDSGIGVSVGTGNSSLYEAPIKKINDAQDQTQSEAQHRADLENYIDLYIKAASKYQTKFKDAFQPIAREYLLLTADEMKTLIQKLEKTGDLNSQQADSARILDFSARFMIANSKAITSGADALTPNSFLPKDLSAEEKNKYLNGLNAFADRFDALVPMVQIKKISGTLSLGDLEKLVTSLKKDFGGNPQAYFQKMLEDCKKGIAGTLRLIEEANYQILNLQDRTSERQKLEAYILSVQQAFEQADPELRKAFVPLSRKELVATRADIEKSLSELPETEKSQFSTLLQNVDAALFMIQAAKDMQKPGFEFLKVPEGFLKLPVLIQTYILALVRLQPHSGPMQDMDDLREQVEMLRSVYGNDPTAYYQRILEGKEHEVTQILSWIETVNSQILNLQDRTSERQKLEAYILSVQQAFEQADPELRKAFVPLSRKELVATRADIEKSLSELPETEKSQFSTLLQNVDAALFMIQAAKDMQKPGFEFLKVPEGFLKLPVLIQTYILALVRLQPHSGPMQDMDDLREQVEMLRSVYGNDPTAYYQRILEGKEHEVTQILSWIETVNSQILNLQNQQNSEAKSRAILEKDWQQIADASRGFMEEIKKDWRGLDGVRIQNPKNELEQYLNLLIDASAQGKVPTVPKPKGFDQFAHEIGIISVVVIDSDLNTSKLTTEELNNKILEIKKTVPDPEAYYAKSSFQIRKMMRNITLAITKINQSSTPTVRLNAVKRSKIRRIFLHA